MNKKNITIGIVVLLVLAVVGTITLKHKKAVAPEASASVTSTTTASGTQITTQGTGGYTITPVPVTEGQGVPQPLPDLDRKVVVTNMSLPAEQKTAFLNKITEIQTDLKKNAANFPDWINLGMYEKELGDYQGALLTWQYAARLAPTSFIPLANLGNLYAYFLNDVAKGENYFTQAIAKDPKQSSLYVSLAEIYNDFDKNVSKAKDIVDQGLAKLPGNQALLELKARLGQ